MNVMKVPQFSKIVVNTSLRDTDGTVSLIALEMISGQKLKKTRSKKFIAGFKLRKNQLIACKVTLRGIRMFSFLEKLILVVFPKIRDFQGLASSFDGKGNISFGLENFLLFPELENHYELFSSLKGCQIILGTTAKNSHEARLLLSANQVPFFK